MICKWCGESLDAGVRACPACGREQPQLSDCGGFYSVVPEAARKSNKLQPEAGPVSPAAPNAPGKKRGSRLPLILSALTLVLVLGIGAFSVLNGLKTAKTLDAMQQQQQKALESALLEQDERIKTVLEDNNKSVHTRFAGLEARLEKLFQEPFLLTRDAMSFAVALPAKEDSFPSAVQEPFVGGISILQQDGGFQARCAAEEGLLWKALFTRQSPISEEDSYLLHASCTFDDLLGTVNSAEAEWYYRSSENGEWQPVDPVAPGPDSAEAPAPETTPEQYSALGSLDYDPQKQEVHSTLPISEGWLIEHGTPEAPIEFRCVITAARAEGEPITLSLAGIRIPVPEAPEGPEDDNSSGGSMTTGTPASNNNNDNNSDNNSGAGT